MFTQVFGAAILPAFVSFVLLLVAGRGRRGDGVGAPWAAPLALGAGWLAGAAFLFGWPVLPPAEHWEWLLYLAPFAVAAGVINSLNRTPAWLRWALVLASAAAAWRVVPEFPSIADDRWRWMAAAFGIFTTNWLVVDRMGRRGPGVAWVIGLVVAATGLSVFMLLAGTARFATMAGALASACGPGVLAVVWKRLPWAFAGVAPVVALLTGGIALTGGFYHAGDVPTVAFVVVGLAPAVMGLAVMMPLRWSTWLRGSAALVLVLAAMGFAIGLTFASGAGDDASSVESEMTYDFYD